jgi:hypothetical protein
MRRRYKVLVFSKSSGRYVSLVVEWQDEHRAWHSKTIKSYGPATQQAMTQAQADLQDLERLASDVAAPVPVDTINDAIWAGFISATNNPLVGLAFGPLLAVRDLIHLGSYLISNASVNLEQKVNITQPSMPASERVQFIQWLQQFSSEDQALILVYQWQYV